LHMLLMRKNFIVARYCNGDSHCSYGAAFCINETIRSL
jgi:hypothetical protein